jgi:hypothetical protein
VATDRTIAVRIAVRDAQSAINALKALGSEGEAALGKIVDRAPAAGQAMERAGQQVSGAASTVRANLSNVSFQVQDMVVQLQAGTSVFTVLAQQLPQMAMGFGAVGGAIGLVAAVGATAAGILYSMSGGMDAAANAAEAADAAQASYKNTIASTVDDVSELTQRYLGLSDAMREVERLAISKGMREQQDALKKIKEELKDDVAELREAADIAISVYDKGTATLSPEQQAQRPDISGLREAKAALDDLNSGAATVEQTVARLGRLLETMPQNDEAGKKLAEGLADVATRGKEAADQVQRLEAQMRLLEGKSLPGDEPVGPPTGRSSGTSRGAGTSFLTGSLGGRNPDYQLTDQDKEFYAAEAEAFAAQKGIAEDEKRAAAQRIADAKREADEKARLARQTSELAARRREQVAEAKAEAEEAERLVEAMGRGKDATREVSAEIEIENALRTQSHGLTAAQTKELEGYIRRQVQAKEAQAAFNDEIRRQQELNRQANDAAGRIFADDDREQKAEQDRLNREATAALEQSARTQADILAEPWRRAVAEISQIVTDMVDEMLAKGKIGFQGLVDGFAGALRRSVANVVGNLLTAPLNGIVAQVNAELTKSFASGGGVMQGLGNFARTNPVGASFATGALGITLGNTITAARGGNQTISTVGGTAGSIGGFMIGNAIAPGIGGIIGAGAGGLFGGALGGLFGGGEKNLGNDRSNTKFSSSIAGISWQDRSSSAENRSVTTGIAKQLVDLQRGLSALAIGVGGIDITASAGNKSGYQLSVGGTTQTFQSQEAQLQGAIKALLSVTAANNNTQRTVLQNTRAESGAQVLQDVEFGKEYDRLVGNFGEYWRALDQLRDSFTAAIAKAKELGLGTDALASAQAKQEKELRDGYERQLDALVRDLGPVSAEIENVRRTFDEAREIAVDLGRSVDDLNAAQARAEAQVRQQARAQVEALQMGPLAQQMEALRQQFFEAKQVARDLGMSVEGLRAAQARARDELIRQAQRQIDVTAGFIGPFVERLLAMRDAFRAARSAANDLGQSTDALRAAQKDQERALEEQATKEKNAVRESLFDAIRGLKGELQGLVDPIKQARGPGGIFSQYIAPVEESKAGIDQFREVLAKAQGGDVDAIRNLVGAGQTALQSARQAYGSTTAFGEIFKEVNKGLSSVQSAIEDKQTTALQGIRDVAEQTVDELVRLRLEGIKGLEEQFEAMRRDLRDLRERLVA